MLKKILLIAAALLAVLLIVIATRPAEFSVTRSAVIAAPPSAVFSQVNVLKNWHAWSPWAKLDPAMKVTYSGPESGVGAAYAWSGNNQVGEGTLDIFESKPDETVRMRLEFYKPFAGVNEVAFQLRPATGGGTEISWTMHGKNTFLSKAIGLFMNMDKMVGGQFEQGLAAMKAIVEKPITP